MIYVNVNCIYEKKKGVRDPGKQQPPADILFYPVSRIQDVSGVGSPYPTLARDQRLEIRDQGKEEPILDPRSWILVKGERDGV